MADFQLATAHSSTIPWINEFDTVDPSYTLSPFKFTVLGRLPSELLQSVIDRLTQCDLATLALVHPELRPLAERCLYKDIDIATIPPDGREMQLSLLYRTLMSRQDIAWQIRFVDIRVMLRSVSIDVPSATLFAGGVPFTSTVKIEATEPVLAGALLQQLFNVISLTICLTPYFSDVSKSREALMDHCLFRLFPDFDPRTAHLKPILGLQKLKEMFWHGSEFHWALAKLPCLDHPYLPRASRILADEAPFETIDTLKAFQFTARSSIIGSEPSQTEHLKPFLAHMSALETLHIQIADYETDDGDVDRRRNGLSLDNQVTFSILIAKLRPIATTLTHLPLDTCGLGDEDKATAWVKYVLPCDGFKHFTVLKALRIPYQALFGPTVLLSSHSTASLVDLLPSTLENLEIDYPKVEVLDWLSGLPLYRNNLPALTAVQLHCASCHGGDTYKDVALLLHDHPVHAALHSVGVTLEIGSREHDWQQEWDEYDLKLCGVISWLEAFLSSETGIKFESSQCPRAANEADEDFRRSEWGHVLEWSPTQLQKRRILASVGF
ncbi:hypothetical protein BKA63DRAFT_496637 [Paraphoma chrysanthemicola]|nr:hypothetical protein BKA63DRAFT_496637 [Paraphoma chrysanthemicola]